MIRNIAFLTGSMSKSGGTTKAVSLIASELAKEPEYCVYIVDLFNFEKKPYFDIAGNVSYSTLNGGSVLKNISLLRRYILKKKINVIICVEAMMGIYSMPAALFTKTKQIIWEHGNFYQKQCSSIDKVRALEYKLCDYYITLTERDKSNFISHFKGKCKTDYIYNPVEYSSERASYDLASKKLLTVGIIRKIKGYDMLCDAARIIFDAHPDWTWEIYGRDDFEPETTAELKEKISRLKLDKNLFLMGTTHDMPSVYKSAAIYVMTSRMEGLPMVLLEAKSFGLPLISFDIMTGPSEIISNDVNGYLVEEENTSELAAHICELIDNPQKRIEFSNNAKSGIERFSIEVIMNKWMKIIGELI
ncbi:MAG: glycosyltransferase family 4 protein [Oscillospiraceae bacterium]|nr:glycosyltransferase family 4 protein [Oscillospiraceae bacterium]